MPRYSLFFNVVLCLFAVLIVSGLRGMTIPRPLACQFMDLFFGVDVDSIVNLCRL